MPKLNLIAGLKRMMMDTRAFFLIPAALIFLVTIVLSIAFFIRGSRLMEQQIASNMRDLVGIAAMELQPTNPQAIRELTASGSSKPMLQQALKELRQHMTSIRSISVLRPTSDSRYFMVVAHDQAEGTAKHVSVGSLFTVTDYPALKNVQWAEPLWYERIEDPTEGGFISSFAPIKNESGFIIGILQLNMDPQAFLKISQSIFSPFTFFITLLICTFGVTLIELFIRQRNIEFKRQLEQSQLNFLAAAAHQLRSPISTMAWLHESILDGAVQNHLSPSLCSDLQDAARLIRHMNDTLNTMLHVASLQSGAGQLNTSIISLEVLLMKVRGICKHEFELKQQAFTIDCVAETRVATDVMILQEVLCQLAVNAIRCTPESGSITLRAQPGTNGIGISIIDTGFGMNKDQQRHLFEKFSSAVRHDGTNRTGGFGLYLVKTLLTLLGGTIECDSTESKGTTFTLFVPNKI